MKNKTTKTFIIVSIVIASLASYIFLQFAAPNKDAMQVDISESATKNLDENKTKTSYSIDVTIIKKFVNIIVDLLPAS